MKFKRILILVLMLLMPTILFACGETVPELKWTQSSIELEVGEEVDTSTLIVIKDGKAEDIVYTSLNTNIAEIKNNKIIAKNSGSALIEAKIQNVEAYITVKVSPELDYFSVVTGLAFDKQTNTLYWNKAFVYENGQTKYASSYILKITKDNQVTEIEINENQMIFDQVGNYSVSIISKLSGYKNSADSESISFKILPAPQNLTFDKQTNQLSWTGGDFSFVAEINNLLLPATTSKTCELDLNEVGEYVVKVYAIEDDYKSFASESLTITKLPAPNVSVQNGVLTFEKVLQNLTSKYTISIKTALGVESFVDNNSGSYNFDNISAGQYIAKIKAVGVDNVIDSEYSTPITITKLVAPVLNFDADTKTLTVNIDSDLYIKNTVTDNIKNANFNQLQYIFNENVGIYEIFAKNNAKTQNEINSDYSSSIFIKKMSALTNLRHSTSENTSTLFFDDVNDVDGHRVYLNDVIIKGQYPNENAKNVIVLTTPTDTLFDNGTKNLRVVGFDHSFVLNGPNYFVLSGDAQSDILQITRFEQVTPNYEDIISWSAINNVSYYDYQLFKNGELIASGQEDGNTFATNNLDFGNYKFLVKPIGNNSNFLSAFEYGEIEFSIKQNLAVPNMNFNHETNSIEIQPVENADCYYLEYEQQVIATLTNENNSFDISSYLTQTKTHKFYAWASNTLDNFSEGGNLIDSTKNELEIEKIEPLQNFVLNENQIFQFDLSSYGNKSTDCLIFVNGNEIADINDYSFDANTFELKVKVIANKNSTRPYYIDSDETVFSLEKLNTPTNLTFNNYVISWDSVLNASKYQCNLSKGDINTVLNFDTNIIDLTTNSYLMTLINNLGDGWSVAVAGYKTEQVIGQDDVCYLKSNFCDSLTVNKLQTPILVEIVGEDIYDSSVSIDFENVANASNYIVDFDGEILTLENSVFVATNMTAVKDYIIKIKAVNSAYIDSDYLTVVLSRHESIKDVDVLENEDLVFAFESQTMGGINLDGISCELPINLSNITTTKQVLSLQVAGKRVDNTYYMASAVSKFAFRRIETMSAPSLENGTLTWDIVSDCDSYEIVLSNGVENIFVVVDCKVNGNYANTLDLLENSSVVNFIKNSGEYTAKIRAIKNAYNHLEGENNIGLLSSEFSANLTFEKLQTPQNITVLAEDTILQQSVTISWDNVVGADNYQVYLNGILLGNVATNSIITDKMTYESEFTNNGHYEIQILSIASGKISSNLSSSVAVDRLKKLEAESLQVSKNSIFSWGSSLNATEYAIYLSYGEYEHEKTQINEQSFNYEKFIHSIDYFGYIKFYVCAVGDKTQYLSSDYQEISVLKLDMPQVNIFGNYMIIEESNLEPNAKFNVVIKYKDSNSFITELVSVVLGANEKYSFPENWNQSVALGNENGNFIFEITSTCENCIDSNLLVKEVDRVASGEFKGFIRKAEGSDEIDLVVLADASLLDATYYLSIETGGRNLVIDNILPNSSNELIYPVKDELASAMYSGNFVLSFHISAPNFIDSNKVKIQGKKLPEISNLFVRDGILSWNISNDSSCLEYLLRVSSGDDTIYKKLSRDILSDNLEGLSKSLVVNIKCLGNIAHDSYSLENIVLDSNYRYTIESFENIITEDNLTLYKLEKPDDIQIYNGDFKLLNFDRVDSWSAKSGDYLYNLIGDVNDEGYFLGTSKDIYTGSKKLTENVLHKFSFQAQSSEENVLYSDFSNEIDIKILPNPNNLDSSISFEWDESDVDTYKILWTASSLHNKYQLTLLNILGFSGIEYKVNTNLSSFNMNCNDFGAGSYDISVKVLGSSNLEAGGFYYLSSNTSLVKRFNKINNPTVIVKNGRLTWLNVDDADRYYIYYLPKTNDEEITKIAFDTNSLMYASYVTTNYWNIPENFGNININTHYYFGVRAVSSNYTKFAPSSLGGFGHEFENAQTEAKDFMFEEVIKIKAPDQLDLVDGTLLWSSGDYNYTLNILNQTATLNGGVSPFVYDDSIQDLANKTIVLKFTDNSGIARSFEIQAVKLFKAEITKGILFPMIASYIGLSPDFEFGWPGLNFLTDEIGNITPGEHNLTLMQKGDDKNWLNSNYNSGKNIYVPHSTQISLNNFVLSWNEVNLPKALNNDAKYCVVTQDSSGVRKVVYKTNELSVDLRDLVNSDIILTGDYKIYVYVLGDNEYFLNGLVSNKLDIKVLPAVVAGMESGILVWDSVSQTHKYKINSNCGNVNYNFEFETAQTRWDMAELQCFDNLNQRLTYNIIIQCIGDGVSTISGKVANIGMVTKLITPSLNVARGSFEWENITGNEGYTIRITTENGEFSLISLGKNNNAYESTVQGFNNYNIRAVGTTSSNLNAESQSYAVSSYMTAGVDAVMIGAVEDVRVYNGNVMWLALKDLNDISVTGFKVTFADINYYNPLFIENYQITSIGDKQYVVCQLDENFIAGNYKIFIQGYTSYSFTRLSSGIAYKQLLGCIEDESTLEFKKLKAVSNISTDNGVISWTENDDDSSSYLLTFTKDDETYEFVVNGNSWDASSLTYEELVIYNKMMAGFVYKLKIKTLGNDENLIDADYCEEVNFNKLNEITSVEYLEGINEGFIIRWIFANQVSGINEYYYAIKYSSGGEQQIIYSVNDDRIRTGYNAEENYYYGEIDGSSLLGQSSLTLSYQICVIPVSLSNTLISNFCEVRTVYPPQSLSGEFQYNSEKRSISWIYNSSGSDVKFRIVDELINLDAENQVNVISTKTYLSQSTEFVLEQTGMHRISICVVLIGESVASSYVYFDYAVATEGLIKDASFVVDSPLGECTFTLINFNLFESGNGSSEDPYVISSKSQFENINQRLVKPSYLTGESLWTFVLGDNLTLDEVASINDFGGKFDGLNFSINYNVSNTDKTRVGLFNRVLTNGIIQNLNINATILQENISSIAELYISPLVVENQGKIYNCTLSSFSYTSLLTKPINIYFGGLAVFNYGLIERCINNSNIVFNGTNQAEVRNSNINIGGIAYTNGSSNSFAIIKESGNDGSITLYAKSVTVGGLTAIHNNGARIESCYSKGSINVLITQSGSNTNYIGGLVASSQEQIKNSYTNSAIYVDMNNLSRTAYIGGLVGYISNTNGAIINNCFVANNSIVSANDSFSNCNKGILVGYSNAQDTQSQTCSFYVQTAGLAPIINAPNGFTCKLFTSFESLLSQLNAQDFSYKANGNGVPKLHWENA